MSKYYFTFGFGQPNEGCYVEIEANSHDEANEIMNAKYGNKWSMQYCESQWRFSKNTDPHWIDHCLMFGVDPNTFTEFTQAELYNLKKIE